MKKKLFDFFIIFHDEENNKIFKKKLSLGRIILYGFITLIVVISFFFLPYLLAQFKSKLNTYQKISNYEKNLRTRNLVLKSLRDSVNQRLDSIKVYDSIIEVLVKKIAPDIIKEENKNKDIQDSIFLTLSPSTLYWVAKNIELTFLKACIMYNKNRNIFTNSPTYPPVKGGIITRKYGFYKDPYTNTFKKHEGFDFVSTNNDTVYAAGDGKVIKITQHRLWGVQIYLKHNDSLITRYAHLGKVLVSVGEKVNKASPIALIGESGKVLYPHLHFEILLNDKAEDPEKYLLLDE